MKGTGAGFERYAPSPPGGGVFRFVPHPPRGAASVVFEHGDRTQSGGEERVVGTDQRGLRSIAAPYPVPGPTGVAVRTRLKCLTLQDEKVLRLVGSHLGSLAAADLKARCADGLDHYSHTWAERKRRLTPECSSRWAGAITKATHDQWALARRGQAAHLRSLEAGAAMVRSRLSSPVGAKGTRKRPGGYRSKQEWHAKSRRLATLQDRLATVRADFEAGLVRVVRGGKPSSPRCGSAHRDRLA